MGGGGGGGGGGLNFESETLLQLFFAASPLESAPAPFPIRGYTL